MTKLTDTQYEQLLAFRSDLRRFLHWSEEQARRTGVTPAQHQLMLAVRGHPGPEGPSIGEVASYLVLRHHSAVGLVDRAEAAGLVRRSPDPEHHGTVHVQLTDSGQAHLEELSAMHLDELARFAPTMEALWRSLHDAPRAPDLTLG
jgi:DNA-binding MarR family transcriptional regulator